MAESTLSQSRDFPQLYRLLVEELRDYAIFITDTEGIITTWNPGVELILGYSEAEFIGQHLSMVFTAKDREEKVFEAEMAGARKEGRAPDVRWHVRKDGSLIFIDGVLNVLRNPDGELLGYTKVMRDITPGRGIGGLIQTILEATDQRIFVKDRESRYAFANSAVAAMFGRPIEEVIGKRDSELQPGELSKALEGHDRRVIDSAQREMVEETVLVPGRGATTYLTTKAPWHDNEGNVVGVVGIAQDISERKNAEAALLRVNEELSEFAHVVAHDLQAPLRSIRSYSELLAKRSKGRLDATAEEFLQFIKEGGASMDRLIRALLRYAEAGVQEVERKPVRVQGIIDAVCIALQPDIEEAGAEVTTHHLPTVHADRVQLTQLFQNLIANALKYRGKRKPRIDISAEQRPGSWVFSVKDNGPGIDPMHYERIFEPLRRLHGQEIPGTGLGLAVCRKIVARHGGRIWVESKVGEGANFCFTLPE
jgi:PAS domain S-box-containing protein